MQHGNLKGSGIVPCILHMLQCNSFLKRYTLLCLPAHTGDELVLSSACLAFSVSDCIS